MAKNSNPNETKKEETKKNENKKEKFGWKVVKTDLLIDGKKFREGEIIEDEEIAKKAKKYVVKVKLGGE